MYIKYAILGTNAESEEFFDYFVRLRKQFLQNPFLQINNFLHNYIKLELYKIIKMNKIYITISTINFWRNNWKYKEELFVQVDFNSVKIRFPSTLNICHIGPHN